MRVNVDLRCGDCLKVLLLLKSNSVDAVVTDPPYGISFMGKKWDYSVPAVEVWKEVLRVLKPGGHGLIACGTRTQHRMTVNIEDAGFEIRDVVAWLYGSGFPKSLNIGKAVDKLQGNTRKDAGRYVALDGGERDLTKHKPHKEASNADHKYGYETSGFVNITKGNSEHEGQGTALKPAMELWTLCRKPLSEPTVAANVLKWGTGGINIDGCRVSPTNDCSGWSKTGSKESENRAMSGKNYDREAKPDNPQGRFPANVIHDGSYEVLELFPDSSMTGKRKSSNRIQQEKANTPFTRGIEAPEYTDSGSAARFFYCAKASKSERNEGLDGFEERPSYMVENGSKTSGLNGQRYIRATTSANHHPTVKPVKLMEYLVKLVTPKDGIVLDPFMGSGTTGIACVNLKRGFIGVEKDQDYFQIAKARVMRGVILRRKIRIVSKSI